MATEYGRDENGAPVINVFPRRQVAGPKPEQRTMGDVGAAPVPVPPPAVVVPRLAPVTAPPAPAAEPTTSGPAPPAAPENPPPAPATGPSHAG